MHESFGARLRRHREEQQIALTTIAEQTRIKLTLLEDLERDDVSHWPAGIFRRAFIRSYANAVGLDPDTTVREFAEAHPSPVDVASAAAIAATIEREGANGKTASPFRSLMASLGFARTPSTEPAPAAPAHQPASPEAPRRATPAAAPSPAFAMRQPEAPMVMPVESSVVDPVEVMANSTEDELHEPAIDPIVERIAERVSELPLQMAAERGEEPLREVVKEPVAADVDMMAFAHLCTEFGRVDQADDVARLLREVARLMDASGMIVWVWDGVSELRPAMTHGYSRRVVAQLPGVCPEDDNATAAAFRSGQPCVINGGAQSSSALVLPLMSPGGSAGVLAIELQQGKRLTKSIRAVATIFAALMAQLVGAASASDEQGMDHDLSIDHPLAALNG